MFTNKTFKPLINTLWPSEIQSELDKEHDHITLKSFIFNGGGYATIESKDFNNDDAINDSCLHCDKDDFLRMLEELAPEMLEKLDY